MLKNINSSDRRSSIFRPSGQIGLICDGKTFFLNNLGTTSFIIVSTLRQFIVYETLSLKIVFISLPLKYNIKSIAAKYENVFLVLNDNSIYSFHKYNHREIIHKHKSEIIGIQYHDDILFTYSNTELITYNKEEIDDNNSSSKWNLDKIITFDHLTQINTILILEGMNNKVLVGLSNSKLLLVNIKTSKILYNFNSKINKTNFGDEDFYKEGINVMAQSCNKLSGVVAIGYKSGYVSIFDINNDQFLGGFKLSKKNNKPTSMKFVFDLLGITSKHTNTFSTPELLIVGTSSGDLIVFDLSKFAVISCIESAHMSSVKELMYIETHKYLVSLGENAIIAWNMDSDKDFLRELKSRKGFVGNIDFLRTYDVEEHDILVCSSYDGFGYLGKISTIQQQQSVPFSTKCYNGRLKKITGISSSYQRHYDWPNIVTCHQNTHQVHVWSGFRKALIDKVLRVPEMKSVATAVCLTKCGSYAVVGYENGQLHLFTLQNCNYDSEFTRKVNNELVSAHSSKIINISLVGNSKILSISNSKQDRSIRVWDVIKIKLESEYDPELPHGCGVYMATSGNFLTALACTDNNVYILDVAGKLIIRKISYSSRMTSMTFHMNDKWLIAATENSTMLVYDVLAACYVDYVKFSGKILDLNIDTSGSFLLVSNEKTPGMILQYSNKHAFELFPKSILYKDIPRQPYNVDMPISEFKSNKKLTNGNSSDSNKENVDNSNNKNNKDNLDEELVDKEVVNSDDEFEVQHTYQSKNNQLEPGNITLSGLSSAKLQTILYLDQIKEKSKPIEPPKQNKELPFFLPTTYKDGQLVFVEPEEDEVENVKPRESLLKKSEIETEFEKILNSRLEEDKKYEDMMDYLLKQTPAVVHLSLALFSESKMEQTLYIMLKFFQYHVTKKTNADALQVFLHLFLKFHAEKLSNMKNNDIKDIMENLNKNIKNDYKFLQESFDRISCYIKFFTHLQMD